MNANELAVYLEDITDWEESPYRQAATMLRQQQAEIGFYKQDADKYKQKCASQQAEIEALKADLKYWTDPCNPLCKPSICDCYQARFAISNRKAQEK